MAVNLITLLYPAGNLLLEDDRLKLFKSFEPLGNRTENVYPDHYSSLLPSNALNNTRLVTDRPAKNQIFVAHSIKPKDSSLKRAIPIACMIGSGYNIAAGLIMPTFQDSLYKGFENGSWTDIQSNPWMITNYVLSLTSLGLAISSYVRQKNGTDPKEFSTNDYSSYASTLCAPAVVAGAVFMGVALGKNSHLAGDDVSLFNPVPRERINDSDDTSGVVGGRGD